MKLLLIIVLLCITIILEATVEVHISTSGDDAHQGTVDEPVKTLKRAQELVRKHNKQDAVDVIMHEGIYQIADSLSFNADDGGRGFHTVRYMPAEGGKVIISGGVELQNWEYVGEGIYRTSSEGLDFRQLYLNGQRLIRARTPNVGEFYEVALYDREKMEIFVAPATGRAAPEPGAEIYIHNRWSFATAKIKQVVDHRFTSEAKGKISNPLTFSRLILDETDRATLKRRQHPPLLPGDPFHYENSLTFLDKPGEWYLDDKNNVVYLYPVEGLALADSKVIVPVLDTLVEVKGTLENPVVNLRFENISFQYSNWSYPNHHGIADHQALQFLVGGKHMHEEILHPPAAVHVENAKNIHIESCLFKNLGSTAIDFYRGVKDSTILGCHIRDIAGNGISSGPFIDRIYNPEDKRVVNSRIRIAHNYITKVGQDYIGAVAVVADFPEAFVIENNEICYVPYSGISIGWGWNKEPNPMRDNMVRYNHIHHFMQVAEDGAGIYTLSLMPGTMIEENYIHDFGITEYAHSVAHRGIYCDECSGGITLSRNRIVRPWGQPYFFNRPTDIRIKDDGELGDISKAGPKGAFEEVRFLNEKFR